MGLKTVTRTKNKQAYQEQIPACDRCGATTGPFYPFVIDGRELDLGHCCGDSLSILVGVKAPPGFKRKRPAMRRI